MRIFIWNMVVLIAIEIVGKAWQLYKHDFVMKPGTMGIDIALGVFLVIWGAYLLGADTVLK